MAWGRPCRWPTWPRSWATSASTAKTGPRRWWLRWKAAPTAPPPGHAGTSHNIRISHNTGHNPATRRRHAEDGYMAAPGTTRADHRSPRTISYTLLHRLATANHIRTRSGLPQQTQLAMGLWSRTVTNGHIVFSSNNFRSPNLVRVFIW